MFSSIECSICEKTGAVKVSFADQVIVFPLTVVSPLPFIIWNAEEIDEILETNDDSNIIIEEPIELKSEKITDFKLYLRVIGFENYESIRSVLDNYDNNLKYTSEKNNSKYDVIIGPLEKIEANNLVSYFISKGYKETEILIE